MAIQLTTDLLKADLPYPFTVKSDMVFSRVYRLFEKEDSKAVSKLLEAAEDFPEQPQFLNLLAQYYDTVDMREKAREVNDQIKVKFPLFVFWRINESMDAFLKKDAEMIKKLLGEELSLEKLYPERKLFHTSEYVGYNRCSLLCFGLCKDYKSILKRVEEIRKLSLKINFDTEVLYETAAAFMKEYKDSQMIFSGIPPLPAFHFKEEIEELFHHGLTIPNELYNSILQKDRKLLTEDLEKLMQYAIDYAEEFSKEEMPEVHTYFVIHAFFLLRDIEARDSLPAVLRVLKKNDEQTDPYLFDVLSDSLWEVFYVLGKNQLRTLVDFFKRLFDDWLVRTEIVEALKQIALHHPEQRLEIESYLRELLLFVSTVKIEDDAYLDEVTDEILEAIGEGGFTRLFPEVERLLEEEKLQTMNIVHWEEFMEEYGSQEFDPSEFKKVFKSRQVIYQEYLIDNEPGHVGLFDFDDEEDDPDDYLWQFYDDEIYEDVTKELIEPDADKENDNEKNYISYSDVPNKPFVNPASKTGRNDPCPCGSGKKYKKCHGVD